MIGVRPTIGLNTPLKKPDTPSYIQMSFIQALIVRFCSALATWKRNFTVSRGWETNVATMPAIEPDIISTVESFRFSLLGALMTSSSFYFSELILEGIEKF